MSLVNDMLNDLDERRNQSSREAVNLDWLAGQKKTNVTKSKKWLLIVVMLVLVLIALVAISKLYNPGETIDRIDAILAKGVPQQQVQEPVKTTAAALPAVSSVSFSQQKNTTTITFNFNADIAYKVSREQAGLQVLFFDARHQFSPAQLNAPAPINSISVENRSKVVIVSFSMEGDFNYSSQPLIGPDAGLEIIVSVLPKIIKSDKPKTTSPAPSTVVAQAKPRVSESNNQIKKTLPVNLKQQDIQVAKNARRMISANELFEAEQTLRVMLSQQPLALHSGEVLATLMLAQQRYTEVEILINRLRVSSSSAFTGLKLFR